MSSHPEFPHRPSLSRKRGSNHAKLILIAIAGWVGLSVIAAAFTIFDGRSAKSRVSTLIDEPRQFVNHLSQPAARSLSCSGSSCHGSIQEQTDKKLIRADEFHVWAKDPHAKAFATLTKERSKSILHNLGVADASGKPLSDRQKEYNRHWQNCLGCHETNQHLPPSIETAGHVDPFREGISCESCHGDATKWLHLHYRDEWRQSMSLEQKMKLGFIGTYNKATRIKQCSTCHVGSNRGDVNHDLIAAGHPALRFEYVWYLSRLPKHWKPGREKSKGMQSINEETTIAGESAPDWLLGQLVTSIASLDLQEQRISGQGFEKIWPELADYNCFACHQALRPESYARSQWLDGVAPFRPKTAGYPIPWGNWNLSLIPLLAQEFKSPEAKTADASFQNLRDTAQQRSPASRDELVQKIKAARSALERWMDVVNRTPDPSFDRIVHRLGTQQRQLLLTNWDQTANILLGYSALYRNTNAFPEPLRKAMDHIRFADVPQAIDSPQQFVSTDGGSALSATEWMELFRILSEMTSDGSK